MDNIDTYSHEKQASGGKTLASRRVANFGVPLLEIAAILLQEQNEVRIPPNGNAAQRS